MRIDWVFMNVFSAIILGAGSGDRMGGIDKILTEISGVPAILHSVNAFIEVGIFQTTILLANTDNIDELKRLMSDPKYQSVHVVLGGNRRKDSVRIGLDQIKSSDYVMIHDGARPCVSPDLIRRGMMASENSDAAIPVVPITDTVKMLKDSMVMSTMDRSSLYASQTPQVFKYKTIAELHLTLTSDVTDDAAIIEIHGGNVSTYDGDPENIKMTNPIDIEIAETILKRRKGK